MRSARVMVNSLHPSELARLLESLPLKKRAMLWEIVDPEIEGDVLVEVSDEVRDGLIEGMPTEDLIAAAEGMEVDDLADLLIDLPEAVTQEVLQSLDKQDQERVQQVLAYDEESAGGLMNVDIVTVRPDVSLEVVAATCGSSARFRTAPIRYLSSAETTAISAHCSYRDC